jgi:hypothetical protein
MSGASIASEVLTALASLASEVGDGAFDVSIIRTTSAPANPWDAPGVTATFAVTAYVSNYAKNLVDGTLIKAGDRRVMIAADNGTVPTTTDRLRIGGVDHIIVSVEDYAPQGVSLYYVVQARV